MNKKQSGRKPIKKGRVCFWVGGSLVYCILWSLLIYQTIKNNLSSLDDVISIAFIVGAVAYGAVSLKRGLQG